MKWKWVRGEIIGRGSFGIVSLATLLCESQFCESQFHIPPIMAVKSALFSHSSSLQKERVVLSELQDCPQILPCFGDDTTTENGQKLYNLFLEYVSGGSLADHISYSGIGKLTESDVRRYTMSILEGLDYIHKKGYVHCDIKPSNILVSSASDVKIADFGLAKRAGEKMEGGKLCLRGTPMYMAPESVNRSMYEAPADVWSLGCVVAEMITGKPIWSCTENTNMNSIIFRIGHGNESLKIPQELSDEGKDFLGKCLMRDPLKRWSAEMLLNHPFIAEELMEEDSALSAVNSALFLGNAFNFPKWLSVHSSMPSLCSATETFNDFEGESDSSNNSYSLLANRLRLLGTGLPLDSSSRKDDKIAVRESKPPVSLAEEEDSLMILLSEMKRDGQLDKNLNLSQFAGKVRTSPSADALDSQSIFSLSFQQCQSDASDRNGSVDRIPNLTEEFACGRNTKGGNADQPEDSGMNGSNSSYFSLDFHCLDDPIAN